MQHSSTDYESVLPYKKGINTKRNNNQTRRVIPSRANGTGTLYHSESLPKMEMMVNPSFPLATSLPRLNSSPYPLQFHQPPLLPLPMASSSCFRRSHPRGASRGNSELYGSQKKQTKGNKLQINTNGLSKQDTKSGNYARLGPDPDCQPKDLRKMICYPVFSQAPPPSSLPIPKFSLKPKLICKVEASTTRTGGGVCVDTAVASSNLSRLLSLR